MPIGIDFFALTQFRNRRGQMRPKPKAFKGSKAAKRAHRRHR